MPQTQTKTSNIIDTIVATFLMFIAFSFVGWAYETINDAIILGGFHWRAQLAGPWCPIYGIGGLLIMLLSPLRDADLPKELKLIANAAAIAAITIIVELAGSYICEAVTGSFPWDYSDAWLNYEGRIAFGFTMRFVIGGLIFLYWLGPAIQKLVKDYPETTATAALLFWVAFSLDIALETTGYWAQYLPR